MLIVCGVELICEDPAAHDKIVIKMTVRMKITIVVEIIFTGSTVTCKNILKSDYKYTDQYSVEVMTSISVAILIIF